MLGWVWGKLLAPAWPPIVAVVAALAVFVGVLVTLPPGPASVQEIFVGGALLPSGAAAAYTASVAAGLALVALLLAPLLALLDLLRRRLGLVRQVQERLER
jgi:hypothetical protein